MAIVLPLVLSAIGIILLKRIYHTFRSDSVNGVPQPPLMGSWIPFLGNALEMAGGDAFWVNAVQRYGPAFRILAVGETRTFVTTPALISHVYKNSKNYDFYYFRKQMQNKIFGMDLETAHSPVMDDKLFDGHRRGMQPNVIGEAIGRYVDQLEGCLKTLAEGLNESGREFDLTKEVYEIIYTASSKAWFSLSFPAGKTLKAFLKFDQFFPILNLSLPSIVLSPATVARREILKQIEQWWLTVEESDKQTMAPALLAMGEVSDGEGWGNENWASCVLAELWALEANAPLAGIWTVAELIRRPDLLAKCQAEILGAISAVPPSAKQDQTPLSNLLNRPPATLPQLLPTINAAFQETLRFHTSSYSLRLVLTDTVLPASLLPGNQGSQYGYLLQAGDQVVCVSRHNQVWEGGDWGAEANIWNHKRFLDGERVEDKKGRGTMTPFGGGVSMCEGRHFASAEILTFIAAFIHMFDLKVIPGGDTLKPDMTRIGLGVMNSTGGMRVHIKRRPAPRFE